MNRKKSLFYLKKDFQNTSELVKNNEFAYMTVKHTHYTDRLLELVCFNLNL